MAKLAIIAPTIGVRSETFIKRHMNDLMPEHSVVLAKNDKQPNAGHWHCSSPAYTLNDYPANPWQLIQTFAVQLRGKKRLNSFTYHRRYAIEHILKKEKVGVILGEYLDFTHAYIEIAESLNIPLWGHAHGYDISKRLLDDRWRLRYRDYNKAAGIITVSRVSKQRLIDIGITEQKIHIIPCGVDLPANFLKREYRPQNQVRCLAVGRMVRKKAPIFLLKAFLQAIKIYPQLHLDFVGTGELMPEVMSFIDEFHLASNVELHGDQPNERVKEIMKTADIFLQHSMVDPETGDEEGLPVAILEAMAHGLPVIATRHAGIPDAVIEGQTGILVNEGDTSGMAEMIARLTQDIDLRLNMGLAGWQRVGQFFSWQRERSQLIELLRLGENEQFGRQT